MTGSDDQARARLCDAIVYHLENMPNLDFTMPQGVHDFAAMGLDSISMMMVTAELEETLGADLPPHLLWDCPDLSSFAAYLQQKVDPDRLNAFVAAAASGRT